MVLPDYFASVSRLLHEESESIRRAFKTHNLSAGENREDRVGRFLTDHLPERFGVGTGLVVSSDGVFSNQADLVVVDRLNNAPLHGSDRNQLWPVESVYALVEVKTRLSPEDIRDSVSKCRRFKSLRRDFSDAFSPRIRDSLFVIWGFESPAAGTFKANLLDALRDVPRDEQPDLLVVLNSLVARAGSYLELSELGEIGSPFRRGLEAKHGPNLSVLVPASAVVYEMGENSLLGWYVWFDSWLRRAGPRLFDPTKYLPPHAMFGRVV